MVVIKHQIYNSLDNNHSKSQSSVYINVWENVGILLPLCIGEQSGEIF